MGPREGFEMSSITVRLLGLLVEPRGKGGVPKVPWRLVGMSQPTAWREEQEGREVV